MQSDLCRVLQLLEFFLFLFGKKALILPVSVFSAVYWQILTSMSLPASVNIKAADVGCFFSSLELQQWDDCTAQKTQCEAGAGVLCVQAYILYSRKLTVTYNDC